MIEDKFNLKDEEYWTDPWRPRKALQRPLMRKKQEGLILGAPGTVALNQHEHFPVALIRVCKLTSVSKIPSRSTAIITAMSLDTYELRARLALPPGGRARRASSARRGSGGSKRDSFSGDDSAMISEGHTIDLARRLQLPASRGAYNVTAILLDQVSNQCRMKRVEAAGYEDPEVERFLRKNLAAALDTPAIWPEPVPGLSEPTYRRQEESPRLPAEPGIALHIERVGFMRPSERRCLFGGFRLPIRPQHIVKPSEEKRGKKKRKPPTAVVPITLLLTGSVDPAPRLLQLAVPSYAPLETSGDETRATGYFTLDLCRMTDLMERPQTYFIYAFSGAVMVGPIPAAFVRLPVASH